MACFDGFEPSSFKGEIRMNRPAALCFAALSLSLGMAGHAFARIHVEGELIVPPVVVAPMAPPPIREEVVPAPYGPPGLASWEPGHWEWNGSTYFWVGGHYVERPAAGLIWVPGRWAPYHGHWQWFGGHWRR
jgi:hypothetical protein